MQYVLTETLGRYAEARQRVYGARLIGKITLELPSQEDAIER
jgi:hypothetical protein